MTMVEIKDGVFIDKENILEKMAEAHRKGLFTDITFTLSDNVEISTSKFLLACRSSYFATMFFDESLYVRRREKTALESKCDSKTIVKILDFIWYGKVKFSDMDFHSLLKLLSVSMWMHLDSLNKGVSDFLQSLVIAKKVEFDDCLEAFNYVIYHNYKSLSGCLLTYIYQNLQEIMTFRKINTDSIVKIVENTSLAAKGALANRLQRRTAAPPAKSKMAARGPQNGRGGLERCLPLGFWAF